MVSVVKVFNVRVALLCFFCFFLLAGCGGGSTTDSSVATISSISVSDISTNLKVGSSLRLSAIGTYSDASTKDISNQVVWSSTDPLIAEISSDGNVTSVSAGPITITASLDGIQGNSKGEMIDLVNLSISPSILTIAKDSIQQFVATGRYSDNSIEDLSDSVDWNSANDSIAQISNIGLLNSLTAGDSDISVTSGGVSNTVSITVSPAELKQITISAPLSIATGMSEQFSAKGLYSDGSFQNISNQVSWNSSNTSLATVDQTTGFFQSIQQGDLQISAELNGVSSIASISVTSAILSSIAVTPSVLSLTEGRSSSVNVVGIFSDQSKLDLSGQINWVSDDTSIAKISSDNTSIEASSAGVAVLTASLDGFSATVQVSVTDAVLTTLDISPVNASIPKGFSQSYTVNGIFSDGSVQDVSSQVTWISSDESISSIDNLGATAGTVQGVDVGRVTITATLAETSTSTALAVTSAQLNTIEIQPASQTVANGFEANIKAIGHYSDGTELDITEVVGWSTQNSNILDVSGIQNGIIRTLNEGASLVTATIGEVTGLGQLTVTDASLQSITITAPSSSVPKGYQQILTATGFFSDTSSSDISQQVTWQSDDNNIMTVDNIQAGVMQAINTGQSSVSASIGPITADLSITITNATLSTISISSDLPTINVSTQTQATAIASYSDNTSEDVTQQVYWSTTDANIASVENILPYKGLISGLSEGSVSLSASLNSVTSENITIDVNQKPNLPAALNLSVTPNVILNNDTDSTSVKATILPAAPGGVIVDGTQVEFSIDEGGSVRTLTATTINGVASLTVTSTYDGLININGSVVSSSVNNSASLYSTDDFSNIISAVGPARPVLENNQILQGSLFAMYILNLSNREFQIDQIWVTSGVASEFNHLNDSPITDSQFLSDGILSAGEFTSIGYKVDNDLSSNQLHIIYLLSDDNFNFYSGLTFSY